MRGLAKCEFMTALAVALSRSVKTDGFIHVQEQLGECLSYLQLIEGAIVLSEQKADVSDHGTLRPALPPLQALRYNIPRFYERMVRLTQVMGAGGILANPTEADLKSEIAADIHRYYKGADRDAEAKIRLSKLAWDEPARNLGNGNCNMSAIMPAIRCRWARRSTMHRITAPYSRLSSAR